MPHPQLVQIADILGATIIKEKKSKKKPKNLKAPNAEESKKKAPKGPKMKAPKEAPKESKDFPLIVGMMKNIRIDSSDKLASGSQTQSTMKKSQETQQPKVFKEAFKVSDVNAEASSEICGLLKSFQIDSQPQLAFKSQETQKKENSQKRKNESQKRSNIEPVRKKSMKTKTSSMINSKMLKTTIHKEMKMASTNSYDSR